MIMCERVLHCISLPSTMSNTKLQIHVRQYSFDSTELRDLVYDDLIDAMDKFRKHPSPADFLVTKVGLRTVQWVVWRGTY